MNIVFLNQEYVSEKEVFISSKSRAFNYGDGCFETVKIINSIPFNFSAHFKRIKYSLEVLLLNNQYTKSFFEDKILHLIKMNQIINGIVKIHISRAEGGRYLPESSDAELLISVSSDVGYIHNTPVSLCVYSDNKKAVGSLSNLKSSNSLIYVLASLDASKNNFDNALLLNTSGNIIEVTNANVFVLKNSIVYTPPISDGCVSGTMREWALEHLDVSEVSISENEILEADEIFISNATAGFTSIKSIDKTNISSFTTCDFLQDKLINLSSDL